MGRKEKVINLYPEKNILDKIRPALIGKTIASVRYMTPEEATSNHWSERGVVIILNDGTMIYPMSDVEGNNPGALGTTFKNIPVVPPLNK